MRQAAEDFPLRDRQIELSKDLGVLYSAVEIPGLVALREILEDVISPGVDVLDRFVDLT